MLQAAPAGACSGLVITMKIRGFRRRPLPQQRKVDFGFSLYSSWFYGPNLLDRLAYTKNRPHQQQQSLEIFARCGFPAIPAVPDRSGFRRISGSGGGKRHFPRKTASFWPKQRLFWHSGTACSRSWTACPLPLTESFGARLLQDAPCFLAPRVAGGRGARSPAAFDGAVIDGECLE